MRFSGVAISLLACLFVAGCTSSSSVDVLSLQRPSPEKTSSVVRTDAPTPAAEVGYGVPDLIARADGAALQSEPAAEVGNAIAAVTPEPKPFLDLPERKVAMVMPSRPSASALLYDGKVYERRFRDAKPINFGTRSPRKLAIHGVDVSRWQGEIDWLKLRSQGANFAYIKATDGGDHLDPMFKKNWRLAAQAGLKRGAYHFFYWCRVASEQADWFIRNVPREEGALPPVIDVEYNGESSCKRRLTPSQVREKMQVFMDRLERHYGQRPVIYTAPDFYRDNLRGAFLDYPFWLRAVAQHPSKVYPNRDWVFWQYSGSGLSHGVTGKIDLNVFHGTEREWRQWLGRNTYGTRTQ